MQREDIIIYNAEDGKTSVSLMAKDGNVWMNQNQLAELFDILFAITGKTAAEIIVGRANENISNMALTTWKSKVVRKQDIYIAKNYLTADEIDSLNRFVMVFLETAELRAKNRQDITMDFWRENMDRIIDLNDKKLLNHKGSISKEQMEKHVEGIYEKFDANRKIADAQLADKQDLEELEPLEQQIKSQK